MPSFIDLTGQSFGELTVVARAPTVAGRTRWECQCSCGTEVVVLTASLRSGATVSCGHVRLERSRGRRPANFIDLTGRRFGRLLVLSRAPDRRFRGGGRARQWLCKCDCGAEHVTFARTLMSGESTSCGCRNAELCRDRSKTHGESWRPGITPEYRAWLSAKDRCFNPRNKDFANYGGRGVTMCERWRHSFEAFLHDMGRRPAGLTLDRKDPDGPYSPANCRWATWSTQRRNQRRSK